MMKWLAIFAAAALVLAFEAGPAATTQDFDGGQDPPSGLQDNPFEEQDNPFEEQDNPPGEQDQEDEYDDESVGESGLNDFSDDSKLEDYGSSLGTPWPDSPDLDDLIEYAAETDDEEIQEWIDAIDELDQTADEEEFEQYIDCLFGEGSDEVDNSWVDECDD